MLNEAPSQAFPLFQAYPRLEEAIPRLPIGRWPTPVFEARSFAASKGLDALYVKREDLSHPERGGNKVRGLEFILADAKRAGAKEIVTAGALGSHNVACTAWHARQLGIGTVAVVIGQPMARYVRANLLRGAEVGVRFVPASYPTLLPKMAWQLVRPRSPRARRYYLPPGGTSPMACLGHVGAALELARQINAGVLPEPDYLYVALGSLGTAAGLTVGCLLAGLKTRIVGTVVSNRWYCTAGRWARLARRVHRLMRRRDPAVPDVRIRKVDLSVITTALGKGYAKFTAPSVRLAQEFHRAEGIELDGTYTAKVLHGAMNYIERHRLQHAVHLFWHTYQPAPPMNVRPESVAALPAPLRRTFEEDAQPLEAGMPCIDAVPCTQSDGSG